MSTISTKVIVSDVVKVSSLFSGDQKILLLSADGRLVNTIQGRASFMNTGSLTHIGDIIREGEESGHYPKRGG